MVQYLQYGLLGLAAIIAILAARMKPERNEKYVVLAFLLVVLIVAGIFDRRNSDQSEALRSNVANLTSELTTAQDEAMQTKTKIDKVAASLATVVNQLESVYGTVHGASSNTQDAARCSSLAYGATNAISNLKETVAADLARLK